MRHDFTNQIKPNLFSNYLVAFFLAGAAFTAVGLAGAFAAAFLAGAFGATAFLAGAGAAAFLAGAAAFLAGVAVLAAVFTSLVTFATCFSIFFSAFLIFDSIFADAILTSFSTSCVNCSAFLLKSFAAFLLSFHLSLLAH